MGEKQHSGTATSKVQLAKRLAVGGMVETLLGRRTKSNGQDQLVVVRRILPQLREDAEFVHTYLEEARLAASVRHPNVAEVYDVYRDASDVYVVVEYISGESLRFLLQGLRERDYELTVPMVCSLLAAAAAGVHQAHEAEDLDGNPLGLVHRDINPSNVLVTYDGNVKVTDFGVARANVNNVYTPPAELKWKLAYSSPEQHQHEALDRRSDVFCVGIILHELLTGRRLFGGANAATTIRSVVEAKIPPPSTLNPAVPKQLDAIVLAALQRDRGARTPNAGVLRDQLEALLAQQGWHTSQAELAQWMQSTLAEQHGKRKALERAVLTGSKESLDAVENTLSALPAAFGEPSRSAPSQGDYAAAMTRGTAATRSVTPARGSSKDTMQLDAAANAVLPSFGNPRTEPFETAKPKSRKPLLVGAAVMSLLAVVVGVVLATGGDEPTGDAAPSASAPSAAASQPDPKPTEPAVAAAAIHLTVLPVGASVVVDGKVSDQEIGPDGLLVPVRPGVEVELKVAKEGYEPDVRRVRAPPAGTMNVVVTLTRVVDEPAPSKPAEPVALATEPAKGTSSSSSRRSRDRRPQTTTRASRTTAMASAPLSTGGLEITHTPADARLYLDGDLVPGSSPRTIENLEPGRHKLKLEADGYQSEARTVTVAAGNTHEITANLEKLASQQARLDVVTSPAGAAITVDGKPRGKSPLLGLMLAPDRRYEIIAQLDGYETWRAVIEPNAGDNPPVVGTLTAVGGANARTTEEKPTGLTVPRDMMGDPATGRTTMAKSCNQCHGKTADRVDPKHYTKEQWRSYFATGRHKRHAPLGQHCTLPELAAIKAFLMSNAADQDSDVAAGVR